MVWEDVVISASSASAAAAADTDADASSSSPAPPTSDVATAATAGTPKQYWLWTSTLNCLGRKFTSTTPALTKRAARLQLAEQVIQELDPAEFREFLGKQAAAKQALHQMLQAAAAEAGAEIAEAAGGGAVASVAEPVEGEGEGEGEKVKFSLDTTSAGGNESTSESTESDIDDDSGGGGISTVEVGGGEMKSDEGTKGYISALDAISAVNWDAEGVGGGDGDGVGSADSEADVLFGEDEDNSDNSADEEEDQEEDGADAEIASEEESAIDDDDEEDDNNNDESDIDATSLFADDHTNAVPEHEYLLYLRDSDIEAFLNGILWMVHMYAKGECSDQGYTYAGRPPVTAHAIQRYIERRARMSMTMSVSMVGGEAAVGNMNMNIAEEVAQNGGVAVKNEGVSPVVGGNDSGRDPSGREVEYNSKSTDCSIVTPETAAATTDDYRKSNANKLTALTDLTTLIRQQPASLTERVRVPVSAER